MTARLTAGGHDLLIRLKNVCYVITLNLAQQSFPLQYRFQLWKNELHIFGHLSVPHIGTSTYERRVAMITEALNGTAVHFRGGQSPTIVNREYYKAKMHR